MRAYSNYFGDTMFHRSTSSICAADMGLTDMFQIHYIFMSHIFIEKKTDKMKEWRWRCLRDIGIRRKKVKKKRKKNASSVSDAHSEKIKRNEILEFSERPKETRKYCVTFGCAVRMHIRLCTRHVLAACERSYCNIGSYISLSLGTHGFATSAIRLTAMLLFCIFSVFRVVAFVGALHTVFFCFCHSFFALLAIRNEYVMPPPPPLACNVHCRVPEK